jgi:thiol:disulfide interchange protein
MDVINLLSKLIGHWISLLGGIATILIGIYERWKKRRAPSRIIISIGIFLLLIALFQAAQDLRREELQRRYRILKALRQEYILSHDNISPQMMAGIEMPPKEWINKRLQELGESWRYE